MSRYQKGLVFVFVAVWVWSAVNPKFPRDWILENILVVIFVPIILLLGRYLRLSNASYTLMTMFLILHVVGSHYTYAEVPFGFTVQRWFGADRNMYDRLVHFAFGFLLAYPVREVFMRVAKARGFWSFFFPLDVTLSMSAVYEIIEWQAAALVDPEAGLAFLGSQGDIWDAQKDMLMAGLGAGLAMLILALLNWRYNPAFLREVRDSLAISPAGAPIEKSLFEKWRSGGYRRRTTQVLPS
jgi:putative membrane protein